MSAAPAPRLTAGLFASVLLHGAVIAAFLTLRPAAPLPSPPMYRVQLIAAPAGERAIGVVRDQPSVASPAAPLPAVPSPAAPSPPVPSPPVAKIAPKTKPAAMKKNKAAPAPKTVTPMPKATSGDKAKANAPTAGGGPTGGKGADVANIDTPGIEFPYPGYINNITRQILLQFRAHPTRFVLTAEVRFMIRRDGSVDGINMVTSSGKFTFDQQALGAVESVANAHLFGPLPPGFREDILPVTFRFTPSLLR